MVSLLVLGMTMDKWNIQPLISTGKDHVASFHKQILQQIIGGLPMAKEMSILQVLDNLQKQIEDQNKNIELLITSLENLKDVVALHQRQIEELQDGKPKTKSPPKGWTTRATCQFCQRKTNVTEKDLRKEIATLSPGKWIYFYVCPFCSNNVVVSEA